MNQSFKKCPSLQEIEHGVIQKLLFHEDDALDMSHVESCTACQRKYRKFVQFYTILSEQLELPIANSVINFIKQFNAPQMIISYILLKPKDNPAQPVFESEVVIIPADSEPGLDEIAEEEVVIRIVRNAGEVNPCFSVKAKDCHLYQNVELFVVELEESLVTDEFGFGYLHNPKINRLDRKTIRISPRKAIPE